MLYRIITVVAIVSAGAAVRAQTPVAAQVSPEDRHQVQVFVSILRAAVAKAGGDLADRARQVAPNIQLQFESEARIVGVPLPEGEGLQFSIDVPGIEPRTQQQWALSAILNGRPMPVANNAAGRAPVVVETNSNTVLMTDPGKEYSDFTHDRLVAAMLDSAFALPIREGQKLTLIVGDGTVGLPADPLAAPARMLYLRINGEDLIALRQNLITRDEAKKRIREWRY